jgi:hypothetical protein
MHLLIRLPSHTSGYLTEVPFFYERKLSFSTLIIHNANSVFIVFLLIGLETSLPPLGDSLSLIRLVVVIQVDWLISLPNDSIKYFFISMLVLQTFLVLSWTKWVEMEHHIPRFERILQLCHLHEIESKEHLAFRCPIYYEIWGRFHCLFWDSRGSLVTFFC